jgi:hypothetical protein
MALSRFRLLLVGVAFVFSGLGAPLVTADAVSVGGPSDCDTNAVVRCGVHSTSEVISQYQSRSYMRKVYTAFGIHRTDIMNLASTNAVGRVTRTGKVYIDSQTTPVALDAMTAGRESMAGSTKVTDGTIIYYKRPPSVSFQQSSLPAFVSMKDSVFQFAIVASCGNPVTATPVNRPQAPQQPAPTAPAVTPPAPAAPPTQTQSQVQSQQVIVEQAATPAPTPAPATPAPAATVLPNTGASGLLAIFSIATLGGIFGYRHLLARRF